MNKMRFFAPLIISLFSFGAFSQTVLKNSTDSLSYAIGVNIGQSLVAQKVEPNVKVLAAAIQNVLEKSAKVMSEESCGMFIQNYFEQRAQVALTENLKVATAFLDKNKTRPEVKVTATGLQYEILKAAEGIKPLESDKVKVHYHGTLIDGTVFDSSVERGSPATFGVNQVIKGWIEGLQMMPVGSKWKLFIPADLAYGPRAQGKIGPNSALIFEVELLEIVK